MFNFNKIIEKVSKSSTEGVEPDFSNAGKKEGSMLTPTLENGTEMYTVLINGNEMGVVDREEVETAKKTFDQLYSQYPEEVNALKGKNGKEVLDGLKNLMN